MKEVKGAYDGWADLQTWAADLRRSMDYAESDRRNPFARKGMLVGVPFVRVAAVVQEIMHRFSSFQSVECDALTEMLVNLEYKGTGRVPLSDFYMVGLGYKWKFWEPKEYLRHLGALDESDPRRPSVVIPNYVYGMNNCLASSSYFSVCCTNKCERLMSHVEREIAAPIASLQRLVEVVSALPSDFVDAPRELPASLLSRLREMAEFHGDGKVPLHGRLFAQWMHHAYPQECPFPHNERGHSPLTPEEWSAQTGLDSLNDPEELAWHADTALITEDRGNEAVPWSSTEWLVGFHWHGVQPEQEGHLEGLRPKPRGHSMWRKLMALLVVASLAVPVLRAWGAALGTASAASGAAGPRMLEKHMV